MSFFRQPKLSLADQVWNRAALERGGSAPREADVALSAMLSIHNLAMNGGLLHSVEGHAERDLDRGITSYEYFGLSDAAAVVAWVRSEAARLDLDADVEAAEHVDFEANRRYADVVPDDSTLATRFEEHFARHPEAYAPL